MIHTFFAAVINHHPIKLYFYLFKTGITATCAMLTLPALAVLPNNLPVDSNAQLSAGVNLQYTSTPYDEDEQIRALPGIFYDNNKVYARGNQFGAYVLNDGSNQLSAYAEIDGVSFNPEDAAKPLKDLDERKISAFAGATYLKRTAIGGFRAQVATDVAGRDAGNIGRLTYLAKYQNRALTLYPSVGVKWQSADYNQYYYGVDSKEAAKSGVRAYEPKQSFHPYVSVSGMYDFNDKWAGFVGQSFDYFSNEVTDSPMVDSDWQSRTTLGVLYKF